MPATSQQLRAQIESALARRVPSALTPTPRLIRPTSAIEIAQLDELLRGGFPVGAISEISGPESSGRTSLTLAFLAQLTQQGKVCAWVDVSDALHPESAAAAGVDLGRLLWVRCGGNRTCISPDRTKPLRETTDASQTARTQLGGNSPHPRSESKGLPAAIADLLGAKRNHIRDKTIGTPGAQNRPLATAPPLTQISPSDRRSEKEQVASDRQPSRRGEYVLEQREAYEPRCAEPRRKPRPQKPLHEPIKVKAAREARPNPNHDGAWSRLDQALRVTDLLIHAGGFSAIVLDMGGIAPEFASRVPPATWFRYRAAAERTQSSLLLLTQNPCAGTSAELLLSLDAARPVEAGTTVLGGLNHHTVLARRRFEQESVNVVPIRKPPQRADAGWQSRAAWAGRRGEGGHG